MKRADELFGQRRWPPASEFFGSHNMGRGLWVGSGPSGALALEGTAEDYDEHFDFVIVPNKGYVPVTPIARACQHTKWYSLQVEATIVRFPWFWQIPVPPFTLLLEHNNLVHLAMENYPLVDVEILRKAYLVDRAWYPQPDRPGPLKPTEFNPRRYFTRDVIYGDNVPRLLKGPPDDEIYHSRGTNLLQSIHLAGLFGAALLVIIGCELCFKGNVRHYFETNEEQEPVERDYLTTVNCDGETAYTHKHFASSAEYIQHMIPLFGAHGLTVMKGFEGGLLRNIPTVEMPWHPTRRERRRAS